MEVSLGHASGLKQPDQVEKSWLPIKKNKTTIISYKADDRGFNSTQYFPAMYALDICPVRKT